MLDILYIVATAGFFLLTAAFGRGLERMGRKHIGGDGGPDTSVPGSSQR